MGKSSWTLAQAMWLPLSTSVLKAAWFSGSLRMDLQMNILTYMARKERQKDMLALYTKYLIIIIISEIYIAQFLYLYTQLCITTSFRYYYPDFSRAAYRRSKALNGILERDNCGQNGLSKAILTEWVSNPQPSDYESRLQTTRPQCSHKRIHP